MRRYLAALALAVVLPLPGLTDVVVKPGETLSEIAARNGVSLNQLMQANGITNPNLVVAGQRLVLPGARRAGSTSGSMTVRPGDTLSTIADANGVSLTRLMQANGITNPNLVIVGQRLVIPGARPAASAPAAKPLPTAKYTVKSGETLSEIADRFGTSTERLTQINRISNPNLVVAGTQLAIPGRPGSAVAKAASPAPRNTREHVVRSGENLSTIADNYGMPVERLIAINKIDDPDLVISGTRLKLQAPPPVKAATPAKPAAKLPAKPAAASAPAAAAPTPKPKPSQTVAITPKAEPAAQKKPAAEQALVSARAAKTTTAPKATAAPTTVAASKAKGPDWRSYGPLQVDWANWQPMGGSFVAPTLNGEGKPVYLAVNCGARKLNATSQSGQWKSWDSPQTDFEEQLITDICKARG